MWKYESVNFSKGYTQTIHLPKWSLQPKVFSGDFKPSYGEIDVSVPDHEEEHSVTIRYVFYSRIYRVSLFLLRLIQTQLCGDNGTQVE